jgi:uncharacterized membrane protein YozB (DUF420 family)
MLFGSGFLGTRGDFLLDVAVTSLVLVLPLLFYSYRLAKTGRYSIHKRLQIFLFITLSVVVGLLEYDIRRSGGLRELAKGSRFYDTGWLETSLGIHLFFSNFTSVVWLCLLIASIWKFPRPPAPNAFSRIHRIWGRVGMIGMVLTCITGVEVYLIGFVF